MWVVVVDAIVMIVSARANLRLCVVHNPATDLVDLVYEVASIVSAEMPAGLYQFGHLLNKAIFKSLGMPPLPADVARILSIQHADFLEALRSSYMIRLLATALADKTVPFRKARRGDAEVPPVQRLKEFAATKRTELITADMLAGSDHFESTWCTMIVDILEEGEFSIAHLRSMVKGDNVSGSSTSTATATAANAAATGGGSIAAPQSQSQSAKSAPAGKLLSQAACTQFSDGNVTTEPKQEVIHTADELARIRLGIQGNMTLNARWRGVSEDSSTTRGLARLTLCEYTEVTTAV